MKSKNEWLNAAALLNEKAEHLHQIVNQFKL